MIGAIVLTLRHKPSVKRQNIADAGRAHAGGRDRGRQGAAGAGAGEQYMTIGLGHYLSVAAILFTLGIFGIFLNRKNVIIILMSIELILLAVNINLVAFSTHPRRPRRPGLRAAGADGGGRGGRDRACHPGRLFPQPRLDRGRRHQSDEGLRGGMYQAIVFLPLLGAILAGLIALAGARARFPGEGPAPGGDRPCSRPWRARHGTRGQSRRASCRGSMRRAGGGLACGRTDHHDAAVRSRMILSWIAFVDVGFGHHDARVPLFTWIAVGRSQGRLGAAHRHADRRDAGGGDHGLGARASLFDRLHGTRTRTGRASSPICRCSPSPC